MLSNQDIATQLTIDQVEDLHNLLYQLNWLNSIMKEDKSNSIISALLLSIDPANKHQIHEAIEAISRINLSSEIITQAIDFLDNQRGN